MRSDDQNDTPPKPVLPDFAAALAIGPEAAVEARWEGIVLVWEWRAQVYRHGPGSCCDGLVRLLRAAHAEPRLRRLLPWTSHYDLCLSLSTTFPWVPAGMPIAEPLHGGGYRVHRLYDSAVIGTPDTPEAAVALLVEHLPPDLGPVFNHPPAADD
ncbi:DUF6193 family natural product biosynthesis protein [Kitasatospora sp. NPDC058190]|uniref:DUF6193 family natural product biosynthesis protein n=1 Tax=Kitasatospora sp. NPDC058190 TaxID=3346371 RepID=UPI0036DF054E